MDEVGNKKKLLILGITLILFFSFTASALAANKFWSGAFNDLTNVFLNWSLTSGGPGGAALPNIYDTVRFDSGANPANVNADITVGDFIIDTGYSGLVSVVDGVILTIGSATDLTPLVTVSKSGAQIATTTATSTDQDLGGAFLFTTQGPAVNVTAIKLKQVGSFATSSLSNIRLYTKDAVEEACASTKPVSGTTLFGTAGSFDENNYATTTAGTTLTLTSDVPVCLYLVYDLDGVGGLATMGKSIDLEITNPSTDITLSAGTVTPAKKVNINGVTIVVMSEAEIIDNRTTPTTTNPACSDNEIKSLISIHVSDPTKDPTLFYLQNCQVWKKEGNGNPGHLTNSNLQVHALTFTDMTSGERTGKAVQMSITISNMDPTDGDVFLNVTKTLRTTVGVMSRSGGD